MVQKTQNYNKYYLPFIPQADINYIYLFYLYGIAERNNADIKEKIDYKSIVKLLGKINKDKDKELMKYSTLQRMLLDKDEKYKDFFSIVKLPNGLNRIYLNNYFRHTEQKKVPPFVVLNPKTYNLLIQQKNNLLAKYTVYMKYMCGACGGKSDFTANQFLSAIGYCAKSNTLKGMISGFNQLLEEHKIISIQRNRLEDGKRRNIYTFLDT